MSLENYTLVIVIVLVVLALELAFRKNRKEYGKASESQKVMIDRQMESLNTLKEISATLKEISQKLDKR